MAWQKTELDKAIKRGYGLVIRKTSKLELDIGALEDLTEDEFNIYLEKLEHLKKRRNK